MSGAAEVLSERDERALRIAVTYAAQLPAGAAFSAAEVQALLERFYNRSAAEAQAVIARMVLLQQGTRPPVSMREAAESELSEMTRDDYRREAPGVYASLAVADAVDALRGEMREGRFGGR